MTGHHRTSSIQRPITGELTRPTRRRRRAADGTPGRGLPERPLPGRPGNVLRAPTVAAARPVASRASSPAERPPTAMPVRPLRDRRAAATVNRGSGARSAPAGPPTEAMPRTDPVIRARPGTTATPTDRKARTRRGAARPPAATRPPRARRSFAVVADGAGASPPAAPERARARRPRTAPAEPAARRRRAPRNDGPPPSAGSRQSRSPLRDVTRPIARDSRMAERRPVRIGYGLIAVTIGLALVAALVVLPVRRWWNQRADLADRKSELDVLREANADLSNDIAALNTPEGIEAQARTALNYGYPGESRTRSVGDPQAPIALPAGYPYALATAMLTARINLAAAPASPAGTVPADPAATGAPTESAPADSSSPNTDPPEPTIAPPGNPLGG